MINKKMLALGQKRSAIRELFEFGRKRKAEIGAENVFDFSIGNPSVPAPEKVTQVMKELLETVDPVQLHGYTSAQGDASVRAAIAAAEEERSGQPVSPDLIYMTCGAAASLTVSLHALVNPGDEVIVLAPYFPEYRVFAEKAGALLVEVPCLPDTFQIDFDALAAAISPRTKALILNSPNNPTGAVIPAADLARLGDLLREKEADCDGEIYLICDEPYRALVYGDVEVPYVPAFYERTLVCYSYSKALSLPGERIGYILVPPTMPNAAEIYAAVCGAGRALGFVCAPALMQYAVAKCGNLTANLSVYEENRRILSEGLADIGYTFTAPDGAFYLFVKALEEDAAAFCEKAKDFELLLVPSDSFGVKGYLRISYCVSTQQIQRALPAFRALYESYQKEN
ncbi:MAG: pyridoxal phosphate-dependent aminotransferase [Clostridia bacterium]|nr:pyridoxal phosphate-dependent aminotransferase [Clostridia bacterium]MBQ5820391.1 pyridoxal phosphate-dependent aminotransferase [Clostridia bacterium]